MESTTMDDFGSFLYDSSRKISYTYKGITYRLASHPYEPCLYLYRDNTCVLILHNAFTAEHLQEAFSAGESVSDLGRLYDEKAFARVLAASLDSNRSEMDFFFAARLTEPHAASRKKSKHPAK